MQCALTTQYVKLIDPLLLQSIYNLLRIEHRTSSAQERTPIMMDCLHHLWSQLHPIVIIYPVESPFRTIHLAHLVIEV